jgi:cysteine synthase
MNHDITQIIGNTPIVELKNIGPRLNVKIFAKLEFLNPTGSHKDRIALYMIKEAIKKYNLKRGDIVVEASSGNTGISVAFIAKRFGLEPIIVIPRNTSKSKVAILKSLGAKIIEGDENPSSKDYYIKIASELSKKHGWIFLNQYENQANILAHYETTAKEIWNQLNGEIDAFVMGVGTGGTITGVGRFLKERRKEIMIVAVTPKRSVLAGGKGEEKIEGLLSTDIPPLVDKRIIDKIVEVSYKEAKEMVLRLAREEGILAGISSGANVVACLKIAEEIREGNIVTIVADSLLRYLEDIDV